MKLLNNKVCSTYDTLFKAICFLKVGVKKEEFYGWCFSVEEWQLLEEHIERDELPSGYYDLCDLLETPYGLEVQSD